MEFKAKEFLDKWATLWGEKIDLSEIPEIVLQALEHYGGSLPTDNGEDTLTEVFGEEWVSAHRALWSYSTTLQDRLAQVCCLPAVTDLEGYDVECEIRIFCETLRYILDRYLGWV